MHCQDGYPYRRLASQITFETFSCCLNGNYCGDIGQGCPAYRLSRRMLVVSVSSLMRLTGILVASLLGARCTSGIKDVPSKHESSLNSSLRETPG
eukprot:6195711-Pleurochrysis_carterae.AAC.1